MRPVHATHTFASSVRDAERQWYDTSRWQTWLDGLDHVVATTEPWPMAGGRVTWQSGPAGRGRVTEAAVEYVPGRGQTVEVTDDVMTGRQTVQFAAATDGVEVTLCLAYRLKRRSPLTPVVDALFIRREVSLSLSRSLARFGARLTAG